VWADNGNTSALGNPDDGRITADLLRTIAEHRELAPPNEIYINTRDHVVYLSGVAISSLSKDEAEEVALQSPGVTGVVSTMGVDE
jgi:osmotically-inducible protein OsmY